MGSFTFDFHCCLSHEQYIALECLHVLIIRYGKIMCLVMCVSMCIYLTIYSQLILHTTGPISLIHCSLFLIYENLYH